MCGGLYGGGGSGFFLIASMLFTCNCNIIHMYISLSDTCTCNSMVTTPIGLFV